MRNLGYLILAVKYLFKTGLICIIALFIFLICLLSSCGKQAETYTIEERVFNESVYASGEILPEEYFFLKSNKVNRILEVCVKEGDVVFKGDIIAILGTEEDSEYAQIVKRQASIAKENLLDNSPILNELSIQTKLAKEQLDMYKKNAEKYKELALNNTVSQKEAQQAEIQYRKSYAEYQNFHEKYRTTKQELLNRVFDSKKQLLESRQIIKSPIVGKVYATEKKSGESVNPDDVILLIGTRNTFKLDLLVDERDIQKIRKGQQVFFETDVYPNKPFSAIINRINPLLQKTSRSFKVEALITDTTLFYPQSSVEANIIVSQNKQAILIPVNYLQKEDSVLIRFDNEDKKQKVITGSKTEDWIEIKSGLVSGNIIIKPN